MDDLNEIENILNKTEQTSQETTKRMVYSIPKEWLDFITDHDYKFSQFAKMAIRSKIEEIVKEKYTGKGEH